MKKNLKMTFFAAFCVMVGCAMTSFAQTEPQILGGYQAASLTDKEVVAATNFAVKAQAKKQKAKIKLVAVNNAAQQVVAGMNYKLCLNVEVKEKGKKAAVPQIVEAIVFLNLKQKRSLTSWAVAACSDKMLEIPPSTN